MADSLARHVSELINELRTEASVPQFILDSTNKFRYKKTLQTQRRAGEETTKVFDLKYRSRAFLFWRQFCFRQNVGLTKNQKGFVREENL